MSTKLTLMNYTRKHFLLRFFFFFFVFFISKSPNENNNKKNLKQTNNSILFNRGEFHFLRKKKKTISSFFKSIIKQDRLFKFKIKINNYVVICSSRDHLISEQHLIVIDNFCLSIKMFETYFFKFFSLFAKLIIPNTCLRQREDMRSC